MPNRSNSRCKGLPFVIDPAQSVFNFMRDVLVPWQHNTHQIYTARGLTPGAEYDLRVYYSKWPGRNAGRFFDLG